MKNEMDGATGCLLSIVLMTVAVVAFFLQGLYLMLVLEVGVRQSEFASWNTYDVMSNYFSNEDKKAHDWEIVDCTLPWEE